jgi:hypothetical protein
MMKSVEYPFCGADKASALLAVREGQDVTELLEKVCCIVEAAQRSLEELAMSNDKDDGSPNGTLWSLSYGLETAMAMTNSAISGLKSGAKVR